MGSYHICKMGSICTTWGMRNVVTVILMNKHLGQADCNCKKPNVCSWKTRDITSNMAQERRLKSFEMKF